MTYQIVIGNEELVNAYGGLAGVPTTFMLDKSGKIVAKEVGMQSAKHFEEIIKKAL